MTFPEFTRRANKVHDNTYTYIQGEGHNVKITCSKHQHVFTYDRNQHLQGYGKCPQCVKEMRLQKGMDNFVKKMKGINPHIEILAYSSNNNQKCRCRCNKHKIEFYGRPGNMVRGFGCNDCLKDKREEAEQISYETRQKKIKELESIVEPRLKEKWVHNASETSFSAVKNKFAQKILSSLDGNIDDELQVEKKIQEQDIDAFISSHCDLSFRAEYEASEKRRHEKDKTHEKVVEEQTKFPGSRQAILTDGTGRHHYLVLSDGTYRVPGDDTIYTNIMELNAAFRPVYLPVTSSVIPQMSEEEKENEEGFRKARLVIFGVGGDKLFPEEFFIEKTPWAPCAERLEKLGYYGPTYGGQLLTILIEREDGSQKHLFLTFTDDGTPYLYGSKRTFNSPDELLTYIESTSKETLIEDIYGPTTQNND